MAQKTPTANEMEGVQEAVLKSTHRKLISGSHILHYHNVFDAYGHLSCRHPFKPNVFIMSREAAPGTISSPADLIEYFVSNAEPVVANSANGFAERHIHSEIYKQYPSTQAVLHSHADSVIPYTISGVPLRPCYHMAGFLGNWVNVFDIASSYQATDKKDMLVRNEHLGAALARNFDFGQAVVLMRGHGFTAVAENIEECVLRGIYTARNAAIQTAALTTQAAYGSRDGPLQPIKYLSPEEAEAAKDMAKWSAQRPWKLWLREVDTSNLYVNAA
ncbi:class II aldolase and Adducin N-terminal domain-containing protein [Truncatella angustata]|uniref:Class II aldolase and Adducin N-terminal domain-containing protein n=1 Tax=Truncatella angustata TaxID=152316 RepID=A0A9P8UG19_9PEZI|nr:class II aldolase and Adducin N-terminal domain-containing protein [Truncatella angustata]KAH6651473.1 class II aldolase and Adducin N-terminal domain-containing protein [Truncatella angustata]